MIQLIKDAGRIIGLKCCLPIRSGPLKGLRWSVGSGARFIRGTYCRREMPVYEALIRPGDTVYDIGAHVGYLSAAFSRLAVPGGRVVAFEPCAMNAAFIRQHIRVNRLTSIQLVQAAVGPSNGVAGFDKGDGSGRGRLSTDAREKVAMVSLDEEMAAGRLPLPDFIKMDIEGGETGALAGAHRLIAQSRPRLFVSTHGTDAHTFVKTFLSALDYRTRPFPNSTNRLVCLPN